MTTCLVGHPSIEAVTPCRNNDKPKGSSQPTLQATDFASRLRQPSHRTWTFKTTVIKTRSRTINHHINHRLLGKTNQMGTHLLRLHQILPYIPFGNQLVCFHYHSCTTQYIRWSMSIDAKPLATNLCIDASIIMEVLHFEFCLCIHCFFAIYPKLLNSTLLPIFHRNISP